MDLSTSILGATAAAYIRERQGAALLRIGSDTFTRADLARVECFNFTAAATLSRILNRELQVKDTREVFERIPPEALALPRLGAIGLAVLGAAFEAKRLGGEAPLLAWMRKHRPEAKVITFASLKHHDEAERARERKDTRARKRRRRDRAHSIRIDRHEARRAPGA
jgi:hypothetical protein